MDAITTDARYKFGLGELVKVVPVGYTWKFDFEQYEQRVFGVKWNF